MLYTYQLAQSVLYFCMRMCTCMCIHVCIHMYTHLCNPEIQTHKLQQTTKKQTS
jgi:hypothetical protein